MLIRIAVAISDRTLEERLVLKLTGISIVMKIEFDIAIYSNHFDKLLESINNIDILIADLNFLQVYKEKVGQLYEKNHKCLPILIESENKEINDYLNIRPIECIKSIESIMPENKYDKIIKICDLFVTLANKGFEEKTDNSVLYVTTRQDSYAISKDSIIYCQSDLKYTIFVLDSGMIIRKLEKLQNIEDKYLWDFVRVHQSFLVNPQHIIGIDKINSEIILSNKTRVPFSRKYSNYVREMFKN